MRNKLKKRFPPGASKGIEVQVFTVLELLLIFRSTAFASNFHQARERLFEWVGAEQVLLEGTFMPPFPALVHNIWPDFLAASLALLACLVPLHYLSYRTGSKSIYLMRRLPDRNLIHKQCWTFPLLEVAAFFLTALILYGIFLLCYLKLTPAGHLPLDIWRV